MSPTVAHADGHSGEILDRSRNNTTAAPTQKGASGDVWPREGETAAAGPPLRERSDSLCVQELKVEEAQILWEEAEDPALVSEFVCKICLVHVVGCGPTLTKCSHLFCGDCIRMWGAQHRRQQSWAERARSAGPERVFPCPVCKEPLREPQDLYPVSRGGPSESAMLWQMISNIKVVCANNRKLCSGGKCTWIGTYGSYPAHALTCQSEALPAPMSCGEYGAALEDAKHIDSGGQDSFAHSDSDSTLSPTKSHAGILRSPELM